MKYYHPNDPEAPEIPEEFEDLSDEEINRYFRKQKEEFMYEQQLQWESENR